MTSNHHNSAAVEDVTLPAIRCLEDSTRQPSAIANVRAGSEIIFKATNTMGHPGPQLAYMARVPTSSNATTWKGDGNVWFKVSEKGATIDSTGVHFETGMNHLSAKIPKAVPNGEYLVRVEHIALHKPGLPQNYVACAQVKVTGGGSGKPNPLVAFPGAYKKTDPGLKFNMYGSPGKIMFSSASQADLVRNKPANLISSHTVSYAGATCVVCVSLDINWNGNSWCGWLWNVCQNGLGVIC